MSKPCPKRDCPPSPRLYDTPPPSAVPPHHHCYCPSPIVLSKINLMTTQHMQLVILIKQDMNIKALSLLLLVAVTLSRKHLQQAAKNEATDHKTVVQANHFFSNFETFTTYTINSVVKDKSLVFVLKDNSKTEKDLTDNPITITLISGKTTETCPFKNPWNICGIKKIEETDMKLKLECKKTPCELSWVILQPASFSQDGLHQIDQLVEINQDLNHATVVAFCNDPNLKTFATDLKLYTNSLYSTVQKKGIVYYFFDNEQQGYYFLTTDNDAAKHCAKFAVRHAPDQINFNTKDNITEDFITPTHTNSYTISKIPETDFRMDSFFRIAKNQNLTADNGVTIALMGENAQKQRKILSQVTIDGQSDKNAVDLSVVFKKPGEDYKQLSIDIASKGTEILVLSMNFVSSERQQVNLGESSYFVLKKGEKINYKLLGEAEEKSDSKKTFIFPSDQSKFTVSQKECGRKIGCEFTVEALQEGAGNIYLGQTEQKDPKEKVVIQFDRSVSKKIREGQQLLLKKTIKAKKAVQFVVNSPNVIIYTATKTKCDIPSDECHQKMLNSHNPIIYEPKEDTDLFLLVSGLDNCEFTLTAMDEADQFVEVFDSKPFTYLLDDAEKELVFKFKLPEKMDVNFNLIAPVNELNLIVYNSDKLNEKQQGDISTEGYITVPASQISTLNFFVKVQKRQQFKSKYIHFTLLVSTKEGNVRLQPGLAHYETIPTEQTRDYVFEFQPKKQILLNFYTHNLMENINILAKVSTTDEYNKPEEIVDYIISTESEVLDIQKVAEQLCDTDQNCELFVRLQNKMEVELDVTVTLLIKDSIIQLKDGLWNSYHINEVAKTSHFYFFPKHQNKSVTILYRSDVVDLKLMYNIWKTDDQSINPANWPFPTKTKEADLNSPHKLYYRPTQFIHIDTHILKECWPDCVVLVSTVEDDSFLKNRYNSYLQDSVFKIMASNNYIEIPEKMKVDVILKKDESKQMLVDLKYATDKTALTFFTSLSMGTVKLLANVYDESNPRCPTSEEEGDFRFGNLQTQITMQHIKQKLTENDMNQDKNPYICILAKAYQDSKISIEYTADDEIMKQVMLDSFHTVKSETNQVSLLQVDATSEFSLKVTRNEGFPYLSYKLCTEDEVENKNGEDKEKDKKDKEKEKEKEKKSDMDFQTCLQDFKNSDEKGVQLADKMTSISSKPCQRCIMFIKVTSPDPSELTLHAQSKYATTELLQNQMLTDQLQKEDINSYFLTSVRQEELIINIQIQHGDIEVDLDDFEGLNIHKTNEKGNTNIHITVPPKTNDNNNASAWGKTYFNMFDFSTFTELYLTIRMQNKTGSAIYTITYSSGDPQIYLQDGLITNYGLLPNRKTKFLYKNPSLSPIYLHLSMADPQILNKLKIQILALNNAADQDSGVEIFPEQPSFKKKTPNPTMIMELPANKFFQIQLTNPDTNFQLLTIGINNQQIIYLPFNHEFPVQLKANQYVYLVISVPYASYLEVDVKKCDESTVALAYTLDYKDFIKEQFSYEQEMGPDELMTELQIKTKQSGSVYLKVKSAAEEDSLLTVRALMSFTKIKKQKTHAGGKGIIEYAFLEPTKAELSFQPLTCPTSNKNCYKDFTYVSLSAEAVESVYAQLVCSSFAFDLSDRMIVKPAITSQISTASTKAGKISFTQVLSSNHAYVGVRAQNSKTGEIVYYKPVEMITTWGMVSKGVINGAVTVDRKTKGHGILLGVGIALFVCVSLICYRRRRRNVSEYTPLSGLE